MPHVFTPRRCSFQLNPFSLPSSRVFRGGGRVGCVPNPPRHFRWANVSRSASPESISVGHDIGGRPNVSPCRTLTEVLDESSTKWCPATGALYPGFVRVLGNRTISGSYPISRRVVMYTATVAWHSLPSLLGVLFNCCCIKALVRLFLWLFGPPAFVNYGRIGHECTNTPRKDALQGARRRHLLVLFGYNPTS